MKRSPWIAVIGLWLGGLAILFVSDLLEGLGGWVAQNAGTLPAAYFLLVPVAWLRRRDRDPAEVGIHGRRPLTALGWAGLVAIVVFPPYVVGYEVWSRWVTGERFHLPTHPLTYYDFEVRGRPQIGLTDPSVRVWVDGEWLFVVNTAPSRVGVVIEGCGCPMASVALGAEGELRSVGRREPCTPSPPSHVSLGRGQGVSCALASSDRLVLHSDGGAAWRLGAGGSPRPTGPLVLERSPWWLLELILIHLVVVALPEEVFYRGFVQTQLAPIFRRRARILGTPFGWHVVVAAALFALSHLVTIPHPYRLAVFFPGLLFGWLRERTGGILAPTFLHAASNVLLEFLVRFHGPL